MPASDAGAGEFPVANPPVGDVSPQPAGAAPLADEPEPWVRRFLESDVETEPAPMVEPAVPAQRPGPWGGPTKREGPMPQPATPAVAASTGPGVREQVEYLAAEGFSEREIARRLNLSREEVQMALTLGRKSRMGGIEHDGSRPIGRAPAASDWSLREEDRYELGQR